MIKKYPPKTLLQMIFPTPGPIAIKTLIILTAPLFATIICSEESTSTIISITILYTYTIAGLFCYFLEDRNKALTKIMQFKNNSKFDELKSLIGDFDTGIQPGAVALNTLFSFITLHYFILLAFSGPISEHTIKVPIIISIAIIVTGSILENRNKLFSRILTHNSLKKIYCNCRYRP